MEQGTGTVEDNCRKFLELRRVVGGHLNHKIYPPMFWNGLQNDIHEVLLNRSYDNLEDLAIHTTLIEIVKSKTVAMRQMNIAEEDDPKTPSNSDHEGPLPSHRGGLQKWGICLNAP